MLPLMFVEPTHSTLPSGCGRTWVTASWPPPSTAATPSTPKPVSVLPSALSRITVASPLLLESPSRNFRFAWAAIAPMEASPGRTG